MRYTPATRRISTRARRIASPRSESAMRSCCWLRRRFPLRMRRHSDRVKTAIAIRHVHFEDLGSLEPALERAGYKIRYADCCVDDIAALDPDAPGLVVLLGGPIAAYE